MKNRPWNPLGEGKIMSFIKLGPTKGSLIELEYILFCFPFQSLSLQSSSSLPLPLSLSLSHFCFLSLSITSTITKKKKKKKIESFCPKLVCSFYWLLTFGIWGWGGLICFRKNMDEKRKGMNREAGKLEWRKKCCLKI